MDVSVERSKYLVLTFCLLAAIRVFVYSAAFPFFGNIDEQAHLDLVVRYSEGKVPHAIEKLDPNAAYYIPRMESPEFFNVPSEQPGGVFQQPPWTKPQESLGRYYSEGEVYWSNNYMNHEASQPPMYYWCAGTWMKIGAAMGIHVGWLLYWIRFMNVLVAALLVWLSYKTTALVFPENKFLLVGIPLLIAIWPQDSYYAIQNDVLSPVFYAASFYLLIRFVKSEFTSLPWGIAAGLMLGFTGLVKVTNYPLLLMAPCWMLLSRKVILDGKAKTIIPSLTLIVCMCAPVLIWLCGNLSIWGDLTGSTAKIHQLGWALRPMNEWIHHPLFSLSGSWEFLSGNLQTFWRGELIWWKQPIANRALDLFFVVSALVLVPLGLINFNKQNTPLQQQVNHIAFWGLIFLLLFMALLSVQFDYGMCENPSRAHPFFVSGRLISGTMLPFSLLYLQGLGRLLKPVKNEQFKWAILAVVLLVVVVTEAYIHLPVFASQYNFYHYSR